MLYQVHLTILLFPNQKGLPVLVKFIPLKILASDMGKTVRNRNAMQISHQKYRVTIFDAEGEKCHY